jgi:hypothetical protein
MDTNLKEYLMYHINSSKSRDIDPANDTLRYICNRFELNLEQRYWLAFLYACTYSPTTTYYIYNEFPDFENVDVNRLQKWWDAKRDVLIFQTDRLRVKSSNQFVDAFKSYRALIGKGTQDDFFSSLCTFNSDENYANVYKSTSGIYTFGRFTLFIYLEMLYVLTDLPIEPTTLDLSDAESCRNGVVYAYNRKELNTHGKDIKLTKSQLDLLQNDFLDLMEIVQTLDIEHTSIWNVETTLCAYKKYRLGKRYVGYYIERAGKEIEKMQKAIPHGVDWTPLWEFRKETYNHKLLKELW